MSEKVKLLTSHSHNSARLISNCTLTFLPYTTSLEGGRGGSGETELAIFGKLSELRMKLINCKSIEHSFFQPLLSPFPETGGAAFVWQV